MKNKKWNPQLDDVATTEQEIITVPSSGESWSFYVLAVFLIAVSSANSVASKIVSVPYGGYSFFLGMWNSLAYVVVYFVILLLRLTVLKLTSWEQIAHVWSIQPEKHLENPSRLTWLLDFIGRRLPHVRYFIAMGFLDGLAQILSWLAIPHLGGDVLVLTPQSSLFFIAFISMVVLGTRYTYWQCWSVIVVTGGVIISLAPDLTGKSKGELLYIFIMFFSPITWALSFVLKEKVFEDYAAAYPGQKLDVFIVNSHSSLFQLVLQPIILPVAYVVQGPSMLNNLTLPVYMHQAFSCFLGINSTVANHTHLAAPAIGTMDPLFLGSSAASYHAFPASATGLALDHPHAYQNPHFDASYGGANAATCEYMPWPYVVYMVNNLIMNISFLFFLRNASTMMTFMVTKATIPLSILLFYLNWPPWNYVDPLLPAAKFSPYTIVGLVVIIFALVVYRLATNDQKEHNLSCFSFRMVKLEEYLDERAGRSVPINV